jgi:hypothetical protein
MHEVTIFVIAPPAPINWQGPADLLNSTIKSFSNLISSFQYRFIGHTLVAFKSSHIEGTKAYSISGARPLEVFKGVFKERIGLGLLGGIFKAYIESQKKIDSTLKFNSRKDKVLFIKYLINERSAIRIIDFFEKFEHKFDNCYAPMDFYGGALWPLYENEGAACSAFCVSTLIAGNLINEEAEEWKVNFKIPIKLIGGRYNKGNKVAVRDVMRTKEWYHGEGIEGVDFISLEIYDPNKMFNWIKKTFESNDSYFKPVTENGIPGLMVDCRNLDIEGETAPITKRPAMSSFITEYYIQAGLL